MSETLINLKIYGTITGMITSLAFVIAHNIIISTIWFIIPFALILGALTGLTLSWSYELLFDQYTFQNTLKLMAIYTIPAVVLIIAIIIFVDPIYTVEEASGESTGTLLAIAFSIVIPFSIIYGLIQGVVLGGREKILASIATNFTIFVGIGHNLPLFNLIESDTSGDILRAQLISFGFLIYLILIFTLILHIVKQISTLSSNTLDSH